MRHDKTDDRVFKKLLNLLGAGLTLYGNDVADPVANDPST